MSRTTWLKLSYAAAIMLGAGSVVWLSRRTGSLSLIFFVSLILLVPGRIQGYYYRDLFTSRRRIMEGRFAEAILPLERFLNLIRTRPKLKRLFWLGGGIYTLDPEAMAFCNLGCARLELGELDGAEQAWNAALQIDPLYPIPFANLAVVYQMRGDQGAAVRALAEAERLGYRADKIDKVIQKSQELLARIQGAPAPR